jgi:predicted PurR-regulated permease PerM
MPVYFVFLLRMPVPSKQGLESLLPFLKADTRADVVYLVNEFGGIMTAFFRGQLLISLIQGVLYAIGFKLIGLQYGVAIGMLMGLLNVVPYLGSLLGLSMALPTAFFQTDGGMPVLAMAGAVIVVVQCIEGYVLTPRIMGDRTGLHPMAIIFAMFFWGTALGGIMGMILAIPLTAFLVVFWRLAKARYIKEIV